MDKKRLNSSQLIRVILAQARGLDCVKCELCPEFKKLQIHHIDKDTDNNNISNLILLCVDCHHKAHFGEDWEKRSLEEKQKIRTKKKRLKKEKETKLKPIHDEKERTREFYKQKKYMINIVKMEELVKKLKKYK